MPPQSQLSASETSLQTPRIILDKLLSRVSELQSHASSSTGAEARTRGSAATHTPQSPSGDVDLSSAETVPVSAPTHLINAISSTSGSLILSIEEEPRHPRKPPEPPARALFLTLHALFPHSLLPALDCLDRGLVIRLVSAAQATARKANEGVYYVRSSKHQKRRWGKRSAPGEESGNQNWGEQQQQQQQQQQAPVYEVRLRPWNCSCEAFTFSAFGWLSGGGEEEEDGAPREGGRGRSCAREDDECGLVGEDVLMHGAESPEEVVVAEEARKMIQESLGVDGYGFGGLRLARRNVPLPICKHLLACLLVDRCAPLAGCLVEKTVELEEMVGWAAGWA